MVSRNSPRKMFLIRPRNSPLLRGRIGKSTNSHEPFWRTLPVKMVKMERRKNTFKCVGVDFSSRFIHHCLSLNILFFVIICVRVGKESFWSFRLPSVFVKGEFSESSRFWGEGEILTLVADLGRSFSPLFFVCSLTGTWGPARVFSLHLRFFEKWMIPNNKMAPLCRP